MAEKKEIIDFLRNLQKATEIKSKANGINLWVLFGAISVIFWTLLDRVDSHLLVKKEIFIRTLIFGQALYLFFIFSAHRNDRRDELRYSSYFDDMEYPVMTAVSAAWLALPSVLFIFYVGNSAAAYFLGGIWLLMFVAAIWTVVFRLFLAGRKKRRFPNPNFAATARFYETMPLVLSAIFFLITISEFFSIIESPTIDGDTIKIATLLTAFYLLLILLIEKHRETEGLKWTYALEADILLDLVTPEVALRKIEHRSLGPRLEEVMNIFFDDLDKKIIGLEDCIVVSREKLEAVKNIPIDYKAERKTRTQEAVREPLDRLDSLMKEMESFLEYVRKLKNRSIDKRILVAVDNLISRGESYTSRIKSVVSNFQEMTKDN